MSNGQGPHGRLKYKSKDGKRYDVGTMWHAKSGGGFTISPEKENAPNAQYPKMKLSEACARVEAGDGFLDVWTPREQSRSRDDFDD